MELSVKTDQLENANRPDSRSDRLIQILGSILAPMGYEVVYLEVLTHRQTTLRLFIDFIESRAGHSIGIEDCVRVTKSLEEPLDQNPEMAKFFPDSYELEVSSPGVDRPLRTEQDYARFSGQVIRVHVFRPLTSEELNNPNYQQKNPKQKNFLGTLRGLKDGRVLLGLTADGSAKKSQAKKPGAKKGKSATGANESDTNSVEAVTIPLPLISKANLEPSFEDWETTKEKR